ncbi:hypothetical protein [Cryobacterium sp. Y82]|uniref:hypothetical protein n=1 Tax=Cryobacterium sp. Y82 TaxID=2045017 RepID=UPI0011B05F37|nr:hypothetical protein [Cryobacterium sp. Y82]
MHAALLAEKEIDYIDAAVSDGVWGQENGFACSLLVLSVVIGVFTGFYLTSSNPQHPSSSTWSAVSCP